MLIYTILPITIRLLTPQQCPCNLTFLYYIIIQTETQFSKRTLMFSKPSTNQHCKRQKFKQLKICTSSSKCTHTHVLVRGTFKSHESRPRHNYPHRTICFIHNDKYLRRGVMFVTLYDDGI